jgi:hypothetical protein
VPAASYAYIPGQSQKGAKPVYSLYPKAKAKPKSRLSKIKSDTKRFKNPSEGNIVPTSKNISIAPVPAYKPVRIFYKKGETVSVGISYLGVNRIVFPSYIKFAHDSKTGDVSILLQGKNAYVQVTPLVIQEGSKRKIVYPKSPASVVFVTKNNTYSVVLVPKKEFPKTVYIEGSGFNRFNGGKYKKNKILSFIEKTMVSAYRGKTPDGFIKEKENKTIKTQYPEITVKFVNKFKSYSYELMEFFMENLTNKPVNLSNEEFINLYSGSVAVSISHERLLPETYMRLFILRRRNEDNR